MLTGYSGSDNGTYWGAMQFFQERKLAEKATLKTAVKGYMKQKLWQRLLLNLGGGNTKAKKRTISQVSNINNCGPEPVSKVSK